jgi:hypothetical protein
MGGMKIHSWMALKRTRSTTVRWERLSGKETEPQVEQSCGIIAVSSEYGSDDGLPSCTEFITSFPTKVLTQVNFNGIDSAGTVKLFH